MAKLLEVDGFGSTITNCRMYLDDWQIDCHRTLIEDYFDMDAAAKFFDRPIVDYDLWRESQGDITHMNECLSKVPSSVIIDKLQFSYKYFERSFRNHGLIQRIASFNLPSLMCEAGDCIEETIPAPYYYIPYGRFMSNTYTGFLADERSSLHTQVVYANNCPRCSPSRYPLILSSSLWTELLRSVSKRCTCTACEE